MPEIAIKVEHLSKAYLIGHKEEQQESLIGSLSAFIRSPFANFRNIQRLGNAYEGPDSTDIFWALQDISFEIRKGDVIGIIGKNGAGKSTLLKILSQITEPTKGRIEINGKIASLLEVGTGFNDELTGRENVYLNGTILGMTKKEIDRKFDEIVSFSGVEKFIDTPVKRYSSGMHVRLAFAVAAHLDPEIMIIDEVLAVGDIEFQKKCLGKMKDVAGQGRTVLFVSHNLTAIRNLCSSGLLIRSGELQSSGEINSLVDLYLKTNNPEENGTNWVNESSQPTDIISIRIYNPGGTDFLDIDEELIIETEINNREGLASVALEIFFYNNEDLLLFNAITPLSSDQPFIRIKNIIPASVFNTGFYRITAGVTQSFSRWINKYEQVLGFELHEFSKRNISYMGKWEGIIKPGIKTISSEK